MYTVNLTRGTPWPFPLSGEDGMCPIVSGASLSFLCCMRNIRSQESSDFRHGEVSYGVANIEHIPFIVWEFKGFSFDCYLNMLKESQETRDVFLAGEPTANLIDLYLVDLKTGILEGIRAIGVKQEFMQQAKNACFEQLAAYKSPEEIAAAANMIIGRCSTKELAAKTEMFMVREAEAS